jgi:hypothetical protein
MKINLSFKLVVIKWPKFIHLQDHKSLWASRRFGRLLLKNKWALAAPYCSLSCPENSREDGSLSFKISSNILPAVLWSNLSTSKLLSISQSSKAMKKMTPHLSKYLYSAHKKQGHIENCMQGHLLSSSDLILMLFPSFESALPPTYPTWQRSTAHKLFCTL